MRKRHDEPRIAKPYWKEARQSYYVNWKGKTIKLGSDRELAWEQYNKMKAATAPVEADPLVVDIIQRFIGHHEANSSAGTQRFYRGPLIGEKRRDGKPSEMKPFVEFLRERKLARLRVSQLKAYHVTEWIDTHHRLKLNGKPSSDTYRHTLIRAVKAAFNWADEQELIDRVPLRKLKKPPQRSRDVYLMPDQWDKLVKAVERGQDAAPFLDVIITMRESGCRPQEVRMVEARHLDRAGRCWVFRADESKGKEESRVVLLNEKAFEISLRLALKNPEGPIFRNRDGRPWEKGSLGSRCYRLSKRLGFHVCPYAIRHTFATDAIVRGVDLQTIATLMGHVDLKMLSRIYQHIRKRSDHLRAGLKKATGEEAA